ncbi:hypothetical protein GCM10010421_00210 [Streptomyces glaucus]|uniref:Secreted protein n=1 Tax=Streptomyces glaucus TaxID=284029 RepID=A0ABP5W442_9ACTN
MQGLPGARIAKPHPARGMGLRALWARRTGVRVAQPHRSRAGRLVPATGVGAAVAPRKKTWGTHAVLELENVTGPRRAP